MVPARALITALVLVPALAILAGCADEAAAPGVEDAAARAAFERGEAAWRAQRREELLAPDGWTSLVGLHWIEPGAHYIGAAGDNGIRLAVGPAQLGMIELRGEVLRFVPNRGAGLTLDGVPLEGATVLRADDRADGPSRIGFDAGRGSASVIRRGGRYALRVGHEDAPTRRGFKGLAWWPGGPGWVVDARFEPHRPQRSIEIVNIVGTVEAKPNPGALVFGYGGREFRLEALQGEGGGLFVMFADRTSGHGSYGPGRYLDVPAPAADGRVRIDFNRAYNPPCAFTAFATCPLPPVQNRLDLAIPAGERAYATRS